MAVVEWISRKQLDKIEKELDYLKTHTVWVGFVGGEADKKVDGVAIYMYANFNESADIVTGKQIGRAHV